MQETDFLEDMLTSIGKQLPQIGLKLRARAARALTISEI
jgi:hypothetical protein